MFSRWKTQEGFMQLQRCRLKIQVPCETYDDLMEQKSKVIYGEIIPKLFQFEID